MNATRLGKMSVGTLDSSDGNAIEAGENAQKLGFAAATRANDGNPLAWPNRQCERRAGVHQRKLLERNESAATIDAIDAAAKAEIDNALAVAEAAPWPEAAAAFDDITNTGAGVWK
jgi:hypothetical protein